MEFEKQYRSLLKTDIVGMKFVNKSVKDFFAKDGGWIRNLKFKHDPENEHDDYAIKVYVKKEPVGYVSQKNSKEFYKKMNKYKNYDCIFVEKFNNTVRYIVTFS